MATLLSKKTNSFQRFGPSVLSRSLRGKIRRLKIPEDRLEARKALREKCPLEPGVYGWLDSNRQLLYVGKSKSLRKRLLSYFAKNPSDNKMDRIRQHSSMIVWEPISHELLALLREQELIHRWRPEFNSMGQPTRMQPAFLCIAGAPAPNARLVRRLNGKFSHAYGPISGTKRLRQAIVSLNQIFRLRDCPDKTKFEFQSQQFLFDDPATAKCIRYELDTCPGPCAAMCSAASYQNLVKAALRFLDGDSKSTLENIETKMNHAANRQAYETAAIYRDCLANLSWLDRKLIGLRLAEKRLNGILRLPARRKQNAWVFLKAGKIVGTVLEPKSAEKAQDCLGKILEQKTNGPDLPANLLEMSLQLIIISWFRKYPEIKQRLISFEEAETHCETIIGPVIESRKSA